MNTNQIVSFIHRLAVVTIVASFALVSTASAQMETHNPYTVRGHQIRTQLIPDEAASAYSTMEVAQAMEPTLFQEIVPCRFISTLDHHEYPVRWGGQPFQVSESRVYQPIGFLVEGQFRNPCSELIPPNAVAISVRIASYQPGGNGAVYLAPATHPTYSRAALRFWQGNDSLQEANVLLENNSFVVTVADQATDLTIDIIGFFIPDADFGGKGDKGDQGERGEMGPAGPKGDAGVAGAKGDQGDDGVAGARGEKGDQGDDGVAGATGEKGDKGDDGVAGAKGEKGDQGDDGVAGAKGEKGDKGDDGVAGAQGEKGDKGDDGVAGAKGEKGDKGDDGVAGAKGEKGDKGDDGVAGAKGEKGDKGDDGVAGAKGDKGDTGERGLQGERGPQGEHGIQGLQGERGERGQQGPAGPTGPQGPQGVPGLSMSVGESVFPPPGTITIEDANIKANSVILLSYIEVSNGNALGVASQSVGSFVATGSPNKPFKYIIFTMN